MVAKILTAASVAKLRPGSRRIEIPDGGSRGTGLRLVIQVSGHKSWSMRFRRPDGRSANLTLGPVDLSGAEMSGEPVIGQPLTLAGARALAASVARERARGKDVISDHMSAKRRRLAVHEQRAAQSFSVVARRYVEEYARPRTRSWATSARMLGLSPSTLEPVKDGLAQRWRDRTIGEITVDDMDAVLNEVRGKGVPGLRVRTAVSDSTARAALLRYSKFFNWCVEKRLIGASPVDGVARPPPGASRERTLTDAEVKWLWQACDGVGEPFGAALRLLLLTGCRRGEVGGMRWDELSEDRTTWTLPSARTKNNRQHVVPLSWLARNVIAQVRRVEGPFIFTTDGRTHAAGWSKIKRRLDMQMREVAGGASPPWVVHDIRRTVATNLQKLGVRLEVTEAVLNHASGSRGGIVGVYQRHQYADEKREALNRWAAHVERITSSP
jgi:integrase